MKHRWWILAGGLIAILILIFSSTEKKEQLLALEVDKETTPTMFTRDAHSFVSDSGYTRYKIEAPLWYVYDEAEIPNWKFNDGVYLEKYNDSMQVTATFICDSAIYLSPTRLWEFIGNVRMRNELGDRFLTEQMFWNTSTHKIYSDSFIHIEKADRIIEGYGFSTDEKIQDYVVKRPTMIIPVSDFNRRRNATADSTAVGAGNAAPDSTAQTEKQQTPQRASTKAPEAQPEAESPTQTSPTREPVKLQRNSGLKLMRNGK